MTDDEKFFAWLDGELAEADAAEMEAKVAADPALQLLAREHRALGARLTAAFGPIADAPVPRHLVTTLRPTAKVVDFAAAKRKRILPQPAQWAAMAATLVIGMVIGAGLPQRAGDPVEVHAGQLYAGSAIKDALDTQLASAPSGDVHIGLTFLDKAGKICRSFTKDVSSGLACREGGRWQIRALFGTPEGQSGDYRMAAGMDPNLAAVVDSTMAGEPFDAAAEKAAKGRGWK
ncbi:MAG: anti-sigma factor [Sphingomicrobium sp.]|jgi:hypothetical protein